MERIHVTLAAKTDFVKSFKGRMAANRASFLAEHKVFKAMVPDSKTFPSVAVKFTTAHQNRMRDEDHHPFSITEHVLSR